MLLFLIVLYTCSDKVSHESLTYYCLDTYLKIVVYTVLFVFDFIRNSIHLSSVQFETNKSNVCSVHNECVRTKMRDTIVLFIESSLP